MRVSFCLAVLMIAFAADNASACPACGPVLQPTWSERLANCDAAALVQWVSAKRGSIDGKTAASSVFEVVQIAKDSDKSLKKEMRISVPKYVEGEAGNLFLLWGNKKDAGISWNPPKEVSETGYPEGVFETGSPELIVETAGREHVFL